LNGAARRDADAGERGAEQRACEHAGDIRAARRQGDRTVGRPAVQSIDLDTELARIPWSGDDRGR